MNTAQTLLKLLDLFQQGVLTTARIAIIRARVNEMTESGRDPTEAEWGSLFDSISQDGARLHAAATTAPEKG